MKQIEQIKYKKLTNLLLLFLIGLQVFYLTSCAHKKEGSSYPYSIVQIKPDLILDDLNFKRLENALLDQINYLEKNPKKSIFFSKDKKLSYQEYADSLEHFYQFLVSISDNKDKATFNINLVKSYLHKNFEFYSVAKDSKKTKIMLTSYYEPILYGSKTKTRKFSQALYFQPQDILELNLSKLNLKQALPNKKVFLRIKNKNIRNLRRHVELSPYFTRNEIDRKSSLANQNLEICYVDPIDAFFLQIQGSGRVILKNGEELRLGYNGSNGHPYTSIGKLLHHVIAPNEMSATKIEKYLRTLPEDDLAEILDQNKSYVFFRKLESKPMTTNNTPVVDGRTLATDGKLFPRGLLAWLHFQKPHFGEPKEYKEEYKEKYKEKFDLKWTSRLVFNQDTGGAIVGPERADLFWGSGLDAKKHASVMRHLAHLYFLVPKIRD